MSVQMNVPLLEASTMLQDCEGAEALMNWRDLATCIPICLPTMRVLFHVAP